MGAFLADPGPFLWGWVALSVPVGIGLILLIRGGSKRHHDGHDPYLTSSTP
jgi:hypothetical protein